MLKLNGFAASNYYCKVKLVLLEKDVPFEEVLCWAPKTPDVLARSPMGKIPFLETEHGALCESQVLLEYIEAAYPAHSLLPTDPWAAAKTRELITFMELHLELVMRQLLPAAFFGGTASPELQAKVKESIQNNVPAFARLTKFGPYIAGSEFSLADCCAIFHLPLISMVSNKMFGEDLLAPLQLDAYYKLLAQRPHVAKVQAEQRENLGQLLAQRKPADQE